MENAIDPARRRTVRPPCVPRAAWRNSAPAHSQRTDDQTDVHHEQGVLAVKAVHQRCHQQRRGRRRERDADTSTPNCAVSMRNSRIRCVASGIMIMKSRMLVKFMSASTQSTRDSRRSGGGG